MLILAAKELLVVLCLAVVRPRHHRQWQLAEMRAETVCTSGTIGDETDAVSDTVSSHGLSRQCWVLHRMLVKA